MPRPHGPLVPRYFSAIASPQEEWDNVFVLSQGGGNGSRIEYKDGTSARRCWSCIIRFLFLSQYRMFDQKSLLVAFLSVSGVAAYAAPAGHAYQAPASGSVRSCVTGSYHLVCSVLTTSSPCPGLNALANHGFIHRNGKNLTIPNLITGLAAGMNVGADFTTAIGVAGLLSSPYPLLGSFDLNDLDQHSMLRSSMRTARNHNLTS